MMKQLYALLIAIITVLTAVIALICCINTNYLPGAILLAISYFMSHLWRVVYEEGWFKDA